MRTGATSLETVPSDLGIPGVISRAACGSQEDWAAGRAGFDPAASAGRVADPQLAVRAAGSGRVVAADRAAAAGRVEFEAGPELAARPVRDFDSDWCLDPGPALAEDSGFGPA